MTYDDFREKISAELTRVGGPRTWTETRTGAGLPQLFPNNQWVHRLEKDIGLDRQRDRNGVVHWKLGNGVDVATAKATKLAYPVNAHDRYM